jgi:DNA-binding MarR family transcriptional regulator
MADLTYSLLERCEVKRDRMAAQAGLTVAEFKLLRAFGRDELVSIAELARRVQLSSSRLTRILDCLERKSLVRRTPSTFDRRVVGVAVTERGRAFGTELQAIHLGTHLEVLRRLPAVHHDAVLFALQQLHAAIEHWLEDTPAPARARRVLPPARPAHPTTMPRDPRPPRGRGRR